MKVKPLVCIPSPRDIPDFLEAIKKIPADKYWVKYYPQPEAYDMLRDFFLDHLEYNFMALLPDDLIPTKAAFNILCHDLKWYNLPVLSGICNIDWARQNIYNVRRSFTTAPEDYFVTDKTLGEIIQRERGPIIPVKSTNFSWYFIRRDVVHQVPFKGGVDQEFDKDCERLGIPIHCDLSAKMLHRSNVLGDMSFEHMYLNIKPATTIYEKWDRDSMK